MIVEALGFVLIIGIITAIAGGMALVFKKLEKVNK